MCVARKRAWEEDGHESLRLNGHSLLIATSGYNAAAAVRIYLTCVTHSGRDKPR